MRTPIYQRQEMRIALKEQNFCFYHTTARKREKWGARTARCSQAGVKKHTADNRPYDSVNPKNNALALHTLDEGDAIRLSISEVVLALAANIIDSRRARTLLYGLQIASQHYRHKTSLCHPDQSALARSGGTCSSTQDIIRETFVEEDGVEIGPEKQSPDPEDLPEKEERMTLGKFLLLEAIKDGHIDPDEIPRKEKEWSELRERRKGFHLQAVADVQPRCRRNRGRHKTQSQNVRVVSQKFITKDGLSS